MSERLTKRDFKTKTDWKRLSQEDDSDINYSDIPDTSKAFWQDAEVFMPETKAHISIRLDKSIIDYFKSQGRSYQSRINSVLKSYVKTHSKPKHV